MTEAETVDTTADVELLGWLAEFDDLERRIRSIESPALTFEAETEAEKLSEPLHARQMELLGLICRAQAATPHALFARARSFLAWTCDPAFRGATDDAEEYPSSRLVSAIVRDAAALGGGALLVPAMTEKHV